MSEELQYTIRQNKRAIEGEIKNIENALADLKAMLSDDSFAGSRLSTWTDGYVARDVSKISSLLSRQAALIEVSRMAGSEVK